MFVHELAQQLADHGMTRWAQGLEEQLGARFSNQYHGDYAHWADALNRLPPIEPSEIMLDAPTVTIGRPQDIEAATQQALETQLKRFHPWRKGPFDFFGVTIDSEWRSDWKWQRLQKHITPLQGRKVLDVGCGNGYFAWRARGQGAQWVVGIDPTLVYVMQFRSMQNYIQDPAVHVLPLGIDDIPPRQEVFDSVFCMGVFYHRRSPVDHLLELKGQLREGGELILETLVVEGDGETVLVPRGRYAQMRNVWFIPSPLALETWLKCCGYKGIRCVDISVTTPREQRSTEWMCFDSLTDFLDPQDPARTIEGYPAPRRAIFLATA